MTDATAPPQDLAALARDVDRLFRARQSYKETPIGTGYDSAGGWVWIPADEEWNACCVLRWSLAGDPRQAEEFEPTSDGPCAHMRTRKHVAALALVEPAFFRLHSDDLRERTERRQVEFRDALADHLYGRLTPIRYRMHDIERRFGLDETEVAYLATEFLNGRPALLPGPQPRAADVARTHRYLVELDRRLREWREAETRREAVGSADAQAVERDRKPRRRHGAPERWRPRWRTATLRASRRRRDGEQDEDDHEAVHVLPQLRRGRTPLPPQA